MEEPKKTSLQEIKDDEREFPWGRITRYHTVGRYTVIEYVERAYNVGLSTQRESQRTLYHTYVDERNTFSSYSTLEGAFIGAFAYRLLGPNEGHWMAAAACKLLGIED